MTSSEIVEKKIDEEDISLRKQKKIIYQYFLFENPLLRLKDEDVRKNRQL